MDKLTNEESNFFLDLMFVTRKIRLMYDYLTELEITNRKDNDLYYQTEKNLKNLIAQEKEFYEKLKNNKQLAKKILNILGNTNFNLEDYIASTYAVKEPTSILEFRITRKIQFFLESSDLFNESEFSQTMEYDENIDELDDIGEIENLEDIDDLENDDEKKEYSENYKKISLSIEKDILNTMMTLLGEYIDDEKYDFIKNDLIEYKYIYSYIFDEVEGIFLDNNFKINKDLYWGTNFVAEYSNIDNDIIENVRKDYSSNLLYLQGNKISYLLTGDLNEKDLYTLTIIGQIITRVSLLFSESETITNFQNAVREELESFENKFLLIKSAMEDSINSVKSDNSLPQVLHFKK